MTSLRNFILAATVSVALAACGGGSSGGGSNSGGGASGASIEGAFIADTSGRIHWVAESAPGVIEHSVTLQGLAQGDYLVDVDVDPATGELHGVSRAGTIYRIDAATGVATEIASSSEMLDGDAFGIDFDPTSNDIFISSEARMNLSVDATTGAAVRASDLFFIGGDVNVGLALEVVAIAHVNQSTDPEPVRYGIDAANDVLVRYDSSIAGGVETIGELTVDVGERVGFDANASGEAWMVAEVGGSEGVYEVNLATGEATLLATLDAEMDFRGVAIGERPTLPAATIHAVTSGNVLVSFQADQPGTMDSSVAISGMGAGEAVIALDVRPETGQLIVATDAGAIYVVDADTGEAFQLGVQTEASVGATFGSDFDATSGGALRIISNTGQNLAVNVNGGTTSSDGSPAYAAADVNAGSMAEISAIAGESAATGMFAIDTSLDILARIAAPAAGELITIGSLGIDAAGEVALDFEASAGLFLAVEEGAGSRLYSVDATTGAATSIGLIAAGDVIVALAVEPREVDDAAAFAVTVAGELVTIATLEPMNVASTVTITGLAAGEAIVGLSYRPQTGELIGLADSGVIYSIDVASGAAAQIAATGNAVTATAFGLDVDPISGSLNLLTDAEANQRIDLGSGATVSDAALAYVSGDANFGADAAIDGAAWSSSVPGATASVLYAIDVATDAVVRVDQSTGGLETMASLGFDAEAVAGLDLRGGTDRVFAAIRKVSESATVVYMIDLATGVATEVGAMVTANPVTCFALGD